MPEEEKETGRIEAFSDGVFAIAITLLVLDLKVPQIHPGEPTFSLGQAMLAQWPVYLAFLMSFLTILIMWVNHHRVFGLIQRSDDKFLLLNGMLLLTVTVVPFTTSLLAAYLRHPQSRIAVLIYAGTSFIMAVCFNLLWRYASHNGRLLSRNHDPRVAEGITKSYRYGPLVYLIVFLLGIFSTEASVALSLLLAVYFTIPPRKHAGTAS